LAKARTRIPEDIAAKVMFEHDRTCCVCRTPGRAVQIHHIDEDPTNHAGDNLAVLCLQDHELTQLTGGFGRKLSATEVHLNRDVWVRAVALRRHRAEEARLRAMIGPPIPLVPRLESIRVGRPELAVQLEDLPHQLQAALELAVEQRWGGSATTVGMIEGTYAVVQVLRDMWMNLARRFPPECFDNDPDMFWQRSLTHRGAWHRALAEPGGPGTGGTIVGVLVAGAILGDAKRAVMETAEALMGLGINMTELAAWRKAWEAAGEWPKEPSS
jgi:hypothetical protein